MMNRASKVRPFLCQFEVEIPQGAGGNQLAVRSAQILSFDDVLDSSLNISKTLGNTKVTLVKEETTDDE